MWSSILNTCGSSKLIPGLNQQNKSRILQGLGLFNNLNWFHGLWSSFVIQDQKLYCCRFLLKCPVDQWSFLIADRAPMGMQKGWIWAPVPPAIWCSEPVSRLMMIMYGRNLYPSYETVTKTYKLNYNETDRPTGLQWISDAALINTNLIIAGTTIGNNWNNIY